MTRIQGHDSLLVIAGNVQLIWVDFYIRADVTKVVVVLRLVVLVVERRLVVTLLVYILEVHET